MLREKDGLPNDRHFCRRCDFLETNSSARTNLQKLGGPSARDLGEARVPKLLQHATGITHSNPWADEAHSANVAIYNQTQISLNLQNAFWRPEMIRLQALQKFAKNVLKTLSLLMAGGTCPRRPRAARTGQRCRAPGRSWRRPRGRRRAPRLFHISLQAFTRHRGPFSGNQPTNQPLFDRILPEYSFR